MADIFRYSLFLILFILISDIKAYCYLSMYQDYGKPGPVFMRNGRYMQPNAPTGAIILRSSEAVLVACPGAERNIVFGNDHTNDNVREVHCCGGTKFSVGAHVIKFRDIKCHGDPVFTSQNTYETCAGGNELHAVGYEVSDVFYPLYTACFDRNLLHTHYVLHKLSPTNYYTQPGFERPLFEEGTLFGNVDMSQVYSQSNQKRRLNEILGPMGQFYVSQRECLTRGHLAARADYTFSAESRATFHYVNSAPQWKRGNAGDWNNLEEALRSRISGHDAQVYVFTGTHGVMTLPDSTGRQKEIYLHVDRFNNQRVPVPMYYYKVVYDPVSRTATAFVSINSSFYDRAMIDRLSFCTDICNGNRQFSWLQWRSNDGTHSFCCDYDDFIETVHDLPTLDVTGRFY